MRSLADGWDRHGDIGSEMCYHHIQGHGKVIQRPLSEGSNKAEWESETERQLAKGLYQLREKLGRIKPMDFADDGESETPDFEVYSDDTDGPEQRMPEADDYDADTINISGQRPYCLQGTQCFEEL
jgi:hypothetical protein